MSVSELPSVAHLAPYPVLSRLAARELTEKHQHNTGNQEEDGNRWKPKGGKAIKDEYGSDADKEYAQTSHRNRT
jgi:hypothetical protein